MVQTMKRYPAAWLPALFILALLTIQGLLFSETAVAKAPSGQQLTEDCAPASAIIILDASGSMWGQIEGTAKITIAKQVLMEFIRGLPSSMKVGLMVYGHRRKGDCSDIELVIPPGRSAPERFKAALDRIRPKGKTPLSASVKEAAKVLDYRKNRAAVILLTDGLETCSMDPCLEAEKLASQGVDFTIHVIGFDVSRADRARLRCMADRTGGLFMPASDAEGLKEAFISAANQVCREPRPVIEQPPEAELSAPDEVMAGSWFKVEWTGPDSRNDYIALSSVGSPDTDHLSYAYTRRGSPAELRAPADPGQYEIRYVHAHSGKALARRPIKVTPVKAEISAPERAETGSTIQVKWKGPGYDDDLITLALPDSPWHENSSYAYVFHGNTLTLNAPAVPGRYEIRYIQGQSGRILAKRQIEVVQAEAGLEAPDEAPAGSVVEVKWKGPGNDWDFISIARPGDEPMERIEYEMARHGNPLRLKMPAEPGDYELRYVLAGDEERIIARRPIKVTEVTASIQAPDSAAAGSTIEIEWSGPGYEDDMITIARPDQGPGDYVTYEYPRHGNPLTLEVPEEPGTYEVRYVLVGKEERIIARRPMVVKK